MINAGRTRLRGYRTTRCAKFHTLIYCAGVLVAAIDASAKESAAVRSEIAPLFLGRKYRCGDRIINQAAPELGVLFVISGTVRVNLYSSNGREVAFRDFAAGEMFGELAALDGGRHSAQVVAQTNAFIAWLSHENFLKLLHQYSQFAEYEMRQ